MGRQTTRAVPSRVRLCQSFTGYTVTTPDDAFDPDVPVWMDHRRSQRGAVRFAYVLPWSAWEALVELVAMGASAERPEATPFVRDTMGLRDATIRRVEWGVTPLTDAPFPRRVGHRVVRIGIAGGRLKASTGYGLTRMAQDARRIARSVALHGHPFAAPASDGLWRVLDAILLRASAQDPAAVSAALARLVREHPVDDVLDFLDERAGPIAITRLGLSMPVGLFAQHAALEALRIVGRGVRGETIRERSGRWRSR